MLSSRLTPSQLRAALTSVRFASVTLHNTLGDGLTAKTAAVMAALAGSASTLTAVHDLPLRNSETLTLAAFPRLRAVTLRVVQSSPGLLSATQLPISLEELTLEGIRHRTRNPPCFASLETLRNLRRLTFRNFQRWELSAYKETTCPLRLPPSLEVRAVQRLTASIQRLACSSSQRRIGRPHRAECAPCRTSAPCERHVFNALARC